MRLFGFRPLPLAAAALTAAGITVASVAAVSVAQGQSSRFDDADRAAIEAIVHEYLLENPEVISDALRVLRERQEMATLEEQRAQIAALGDQLFDNPQSPVMGNPDGDVTVVEFFDYNCGYCKTVLDDVFALVEQDADVRVVFKELPILAPSSVTAARAALAASAQGLYVDYHNALMEHRGGLSDDTIFSLAEQVGLDVDRLRADMEDPAIDRAIADNLALARALGVRGTPAFVVGETVIPGAVGLDDLRQAVDDARSG